MAWWPSAASVINVAAPLIKNAEGFSPVPYICPAGKPTIGWGATRYPDGRAVSMSDAPITQAQAEEFLEASARRVLAQLQQPGLITRSPTLDQAAAFLSLAYNIGVGCHDGVKGDLADSTLLEKFNRGDLRGCADQFLLWNKAHVKGVLTVEPGLTKRRIAERSLFLADAGAGAGV